MSEEFIVNVNESPVEIQVNVDCLSSVHVSIDQTIQDIQVNLENCSTDIQVDIDQTVEQIEVFLGDAIAIFEEQDRAMAAEAALSASIVSETNRAKGVENTLSAQLISLNLSVIDAGSDNTSYVNSVSAKLDQEIINRITNDAALSAQTYSLSGKEQSHFNFLSAGLNAETVSRIASDNTLSTRIDSVSSGLNTEITNRVSGDNALSTRINTLSTSVNTLSTLESNHYNTLQTKTDTISGNLNAEIANRVAGDAGLSSRITTLSTLESNHFLFLSANIGSNSSRITSLSSSLNSEITNRIAGDAVLGSRIDSLSTLEASHYNTLQTKTDTISGNLNAEIANRIAGDNALSNRVNTLSTSVNTLSTLEWNHYQELTNKTNTLSSSLNTEIANRIAGDNSLSNRIDTLSTLDSSNYNSLLTKTNAISANLNAEISRSIAIDNSLSAQLLSLSAKEYSHYNTLQTKTDTISGNLNTEIANRIAGDNVLSDTITDETNRALNAENVISINVTSLSAQFIDHESEDASIHNDIYSKIFSLSSYDQLTFDFFQTKTDTISANLNAEINRSTNLDSVHTSRIATLSSSINNEIINRVSADNALSSKIISLSSLEASHYNTLQTKTNTISGNLIVETANRIAGDNALNDSITDETNRALDAENVITSNVLALSSEFLAHESEDGSIHDDLYSKVFTLSSNEQSHFDYLQTKTDTISANLNAEIDRSTNLDSVHSSRIETLSSSIGSVSSQIASLSSLEAIHYTQLTNQTGSLSGSLMTLESELDTAFSLSGVNVTFNGTNITAPSQTLSLPASIVTRSLGDARYDTLADNQTITGTKVFTSGAGIRAQNTLPAVWLDETDGTTPKGATLRLSNNVLEFAKMGTNFGSTEAVPIKFNIMAPADSLTLNSSGKLAVGAVSPSARIHADSTTEQLRLSYDDTFYASITIDSTSSLTVGGNSNWKFANPTEFLNQVDVFGYYRTTSSAPGLWMDMGTAAKSCYIVLSGGALQIQRRATGFGAFEATLMNINVSAPNGSFTMDSSGRVTIPNGLVGVTDGSSAGSGEIGQYIASSVLIANAVAATNNVSFNITSISLPAGDWDVEGHVTMAYTTATVTQLTAGISSASATLPPSSNYIQSGLRLTSTTFNNSVTIQANRFSLTSTTTIYLIGHTVFSAGTAEGFGRIAARRVR